MERLRFITPEKKMFMIIIDGLGDRIIKGKTPLSEAKIDNINKMAKKSRLGTHTYEFKTLGSAVAHWMLFGYPLEKFPGRGIFDALGYGMKLKRGWTYFRANFSTVDKNLRILDRRAGRDEYGLDKLEKEINKIAKEYNAEFHRTLGHRGVLVFKEKLDFVDDVDPYEVGKKVKIPKNDVGKFLLDVYKRLKGHPLNKERKKLGKLPANFILIRGYSRPVDIEKFGERYGLKAWATADEKSLYLGIARFLGMKSFGLKDEEKIEKALRNFEKFDFFFIHFKKADVYGHDGNFEKKKEYLEYIDQFFEELIDIDAVVLITGDHSTPWILRNHSGDPCPFLIYNRDIDGERKEFNEKNALRGYFGIRNTKEIFYLLINEAGAMGPMKEIHIA